MMKRFRRIAVTAAVAALALSSVAGLATPAEAGPAHGLQPVVDRHGEEAYQSLGSSAASYAREMGISQAELHNVLKQDKTMGVDKQGKIRVTEEGLPSEALSAASAASWTTTPTFSTSTTFSLHSSQSTKKIYLDFNGHTATGTYWNTANGLSSITSRPFDLDGNPSTFSATEHAYIQNAFMSVREDYSMFDVDVTTEDPGVEALRKTSPTDTAYGVRVVITPSDFRSCGCGGYAYVGSFDWSDGSPAYVLNLGMKSLAETVSHEVGHTLGLNHDGLTTGAEYYGGHGDWGPIMGAPYTRRISQWSKGEYANANNTQDDIAVIEANGISAVTGDEGGTPATATPLLLGSLVSVSHRISFTGDVDAFKFTVPFGAPRTVTMRASNYYGNVVDTNLNIRLRLRNSAGTLLATANPTETTSATLSQVLAPGTYYVYLDGVGEGSPLSGGYSSYASAGQYLISAR
jgi:hypothetical protein